MLITSKLLHWQRVGYYIIVCMRKAGGAWGRREQGNDGGSEQEARGGRREQGNEGRSEQEARGAVDASVVQLPP